MDDADAGTKGRLQPRHEQVVGSSSSSASSSWSVPVAEKIYAKVFEHEPIEWNRIGVFQDVSVRLIAERLLPSRLHGTTYLRYELARHDLSVPPPSDGKRFHVCCSPHNAGAYECMRELSQGLGGGSSDLCLRLTNEMDDLEDSERMLIYLNSKTFTQTRDELTKDVERAMDAGIRLLVVHEAPAMDPPMARGSLKFQHVLEATPERLLTREPSVYHMIAISLKAGEWRRVGQAMLAQEIAEGISHQEIGRRFAFSGWCCSLLLGQTPSPRSEGEVQARQMRRAFIAQRVHSAFRLPAHFRSSHGSSARMRESGLEVVALEMDASQSSGGGGSTGSSRLLGGEKSRRCGPSMGPLEHAAEAMMTIEDARHADDGDGNTGGQVSRATMV
jgi:hypothetical protein